LNSTLLYWGASQWGYDLAISVLAEGFSQICAIFHLNAKVINYAILYGCNKKRSPELVTFKE